MDHALPLPFRFSLRVTNAGSRWAWGVVESFVFSLPNERWASKLRVRYLKSRGATVGQNVTINRKCRFYGFALIEIGDHAAIADRCTFDIGPGTTRLRIGQHVLFGPECYVRNANHRFIDPETPFASQGHEDRPITVGNNVWVGARCVLLAGAALGNGSVLSAGSCLGTEIPERCLAAGNPAKALRFL